ncbi:hypothetical protein JCM19240_1546 [Vibrio maritimus]|uniref:N-acetyltransferase domain-containing protein n=1 Tax=Vibrio maritimus TaxID=990268 RepID=A0A090TBJ8_9VIBR|nr:hypothetical protein JCM19240_1546 [Vibrio maritimus]
MEAMSTLIAFGREQMGARCIFAETRAGNKAAIAVCERLGLQKVNRESDDLTQMSVIRLERCY